MPTNLTAVSDANSIAGVFLAMNDAVGGLFGGLAIVTVFVGIMGMAMMRQNPPAESILFASFLTLPVAGVFLYMGAAGIVWVVADIIVLGVSAIAVVLRR